jgi:hypothetical protein
MLDRDLLGIVPLELAVGQESADPSGLDHAGEAAGGILAPVQYLAFGAGGVSEVDRGRAAMFSALKSQLTGRNGAQRSDETAKVAKARRFGKSDRTRSATPPDARRRAPRISSERRLPNEGRNR